MKKLRIILCAILSLLLLASCGGPKLLSIIPAYAGSGVTSTHHEFTKGDFYVLATYADGTDKQVTDFEFEVQGMDAGYYIIEITYEDMDNMCYVPIEMDFYPSDALADSSADETEHTHD